MDAEIPADRIVTGTMDRAAGATVEETESRIADAINRPHLAAEDRKADADVLPQNRPAHPRLCQGHRDRLMKTVDASTVDLT